jgi:hypothetical protein
MKFKMPNMSLPPAEQPRTFGGKLLASTPVVMTVVATLMAGLSTSEMTRAQYDRSLAAQQQSKVGDQWSFFQAKRLRGTSLRASLQLLQATADLSPLDPDALRQAAGSAVPAANLASAADLLAHNQLPGFKPQPLTDSRLQAALAALGTGRPEPEAMKALEEVKPATVEAALLTAQENSRGFDAVVSPVSQVLDTLDAHLAASLPAARDTLRPLARNFTAARLRYDAARYDAEARYNRAIAELHEMQVRLSNRSAARHHLRSQRFFFGMLGAQAAVILSSLGLAMQRRNVMWSFAALIGLAALGFGVYVYLCI